MRDIDAQKLFCLINATQMHIAEPHFGRQRPKKWETILCSLESEVWLFFSLVYFHCLAFFQTQFFLCENFSKLLKQQGNTS